MKKTLKVLFTVTLILSFVLSGCGQKDDGKLKIGVIQLTEHPALDAAYDGFIEGLKEAGYEDGVNISIDFNSAQGDQSNCDTIATKLVNDRSDLILAIATPAAQAVANKTDTIPVLVTAVTDPETSGLVDSNEAPGGNISGTSDLTPVKEQIKLLQDLLPEAKSVAVLFNSAETNSQFQAELAKAEIEAAGLTYIEATVSNTNEIQSVVQSLVRKADVIYSPTDNMIAQSMSAVSSIATENNIPCIVGEEGMVTTGGLATYGINYFNLGKQTAMQAVKILKDGANPGDMPIEYLTDCTLIINQTTLNELGLVIPEDKLVGATFIE